MPLARVTLVTRLLGASVAVGGWVGFGVRVGAGVCVAVTVAGALVGTGVVAGAVSVAGAVAVAATVAVAPIENEELQAREQTTRSVPASQTERDMVLSFTEMLFGKSEAGGPKLRDGSPFQLLASCFSAKWSG